MKNIIKNWGIIIPKEAYIAEYLLENRPKQCFYIDVLPHPVDCENSQKYNQFENEMIFQQVLDGRVAKENFLAWEMKYRNIMIKLWLYNELVIEYAFPEKKFGEISRIKNDEIPLIIDKSYVDRFKEIQRQYDNEVSIVVTEKADVELFVQSAMRDVLCTTYYLKEFELVIIPSWACFIVYFNNLDKFQIVKDIVFSEGLFLRPGI